MSPKKKPGGAKPKAVGKDDGDLPIEQKYKKALEEIETLKEMLSLNKDMTQHIHAVSKQCREQTHIAEQKLSKFNKKQAQINADTARQYKTLQTEVDLRNTTLDYNKFQVQTKHESTHKKLISIEREKNRLCEEKDNEIADQRDSLENLVDKLDAANKKWEVQALRIQSDHKEKIINCGHKPLEF